MFDILTAAYVQGRFHRGLRLRVIEAADGRQHCGPAHFQLNEVANDNSDTVSVESAEAFDDYIFTRFESHTLIVPLPLDIAASGLYTGKMTVPSTAFHAFAPTKSQLVNIDEKRHPNLFNVVADGFGGSISTESKTWFEAYGRFGDDFEEAASRYKPNAREKGKLHPYIDDPWKLTGYLHEEISLATHYVATMSVPPLLREGTYDQSVIFLMRTVSRHGMAPDALIDCAEWYSHGNTIHPSAATYNSGWAALLFGTPASSWTAEDMAWLVEFGDKLAFQAAYKALTGIQSALSFSRVRLPFSALQAVLVDGVAPEYVKEAFLDGASD